MKRFSLQQNLCYKKFTKLLLFFTCLQICFKQWYIINEVFSHAKYFNDMIWVSCNHLPIKVKLNLRHGFLSRQFLTIKMLQFGKIIVTKNASSFIHLGGEM
jgi:hypothetical protein